MPDFRGLLSDALWDISLVDFLGVVGTLSGPSPFERLATHLNAGNAEHAATVTSFAEAYRQEARGAADFGAREGLSIIFEMGRRHGQSPPEKFAESESLEGQIAGLIAGVLMSRDHRTQLPMLHVMTCIHANIRLNRARQFKPNDFYDFNHAAAALPYCDALLTERSLADLTKRTNTALAKTYACRVTADLDEAVSIVQQLAVNSGVPVL